MEPFGLWTKIWRRFRCTTMTLATCSRDILGDDVDLLGRHEEPVSNLILQPKLLNNCVRSHADLYCSTSLRVSSRPDR